MLVERRDLPTHAYESRVIASRTVSEGGDKPGD